MQKTHHKTQHKQIKLMMDDDAKNERIKFLEEELVATRMQLALAKRSEDSLKVQLSNMSIELESFTGNGNTNVCSEPSIPLKSSQNTVPSPFLNTKKNSIKTIKCALKTAPKKKKVLKPNSCASALDLMAHASLSSATDVRVSASRLDRNIARLLSSSSSVGSIIDTSSEETNKNAYWKRFE